MQLIEKNAPDLNPGASEGTLSFCYGLRVGHWREGEVSSVSSGKL